MNILPKTLAAFCSCLLLAGCGKDTVAPQPHVMSNDTMNTTAWNQATKWRHRILICFGDRSKEFMAPFEDETAALLDRQLLVIDDSDMQVLPEGPLPSPAEPGSLGSHYGPIEDGVVAVLVGKDGGIKYRYREPIRPVEVYDRIDAMPMRIDEMKSSGDQRSPD